MGGETSRDYFGAAEIDDYLDVLSNRYRRTILLLLNRNRINHVDDLLIRSNDTHENMRMKLIHLHLPKLEELKYIVWDRETNEIEKGPRFDEIEPFLDRFEDIFEDG